MALYYLLFWVMQFFVVLMTTSNVFNEHCDRCGDKGIHSHMRKVLNSNIMFVYFVFYFNQKYI